MLAADGELTSAERAELAGDPATEASVHELGALVRGHLELAADEAEPRFADLWDLIERRLDVDEEPVERAAEPAGSRWAAVRSWFSGHRSHLATGLISAGAVAALAFALRPAPTEREVVRAPPAILQIDTALSASPPEVESLDVTGGSGTVFTITDEDGETAVIWVDLDDPADVTEGI